VAASEQVSEGPIWRMVLGLGVVLAIVGALELAALWFPTDFAVPAWRFSTSTAFLDRFPALLLGAALMLAGAVALGYRITAPLFYPGALILAAVLAWRGTSARDRA
jgi:hypothetical protein